VAAWAVGDGFDPRVSVAKKDSARALSQHTPVLSIDRFSLSAS